MKPFSPFNHQRDEVLGRALHELLSPDDHRAFVNRVVRSARVQFMGRMGSGDWWDILSAWARPGLVAAAVVATLGLVPIFGTPDPPSSVALEDTLSRVPNPDERASFLVADEAPDFDIILASGIDNPAGR